VEVDPKQRLVRRREAYRPAAGSPAAAILQASVDLGLGSSFRAVLVTAGHPRFAHVPRSSLSFHGVCSHLMAWLISPY